jgi:putative ABC transport system ATP-binding protein
MNNKQTVIQAKNLIKTFEKGRIKPLNGVNFKIKKGELVAIKGPSGCGKSTLLNMIGALDEPTSGEIIVDGINVNKIKNIDLFRNKKIGFVFQLHNLIPQLTVLENVLIPTFEVKLPKKEKITKAKNLLKLVRLIDKSGQLPTKLSGGERQRVAIARALVNEPEIILADEPTGNLDSYSTQEILKFLQKINKANKTTLIIVTHEPTVAKIADRILHMMDGKIKNDEVI